MRRQERAAGVIVVVLLSVIALAAMAEVVAGRGTSATPAAPRASTWQPVLRVAEEAREQGDVRAARRAYLTALFRARGERSLEGVLGAAEGFAALGDREVVEQAVRMAATLQTTGADDTVRLRALHERLAAAEPITPAHRR